MTTIFTLLVLFQIKHFLADFPLQTRWMLGKFQPGWEFVYPLLAHTAIHAIFTFFITLFFITPLLAFGLAIFDLVVHFIVDRLKAGPKYLGRFKNVQEAPFWICIGADQLFHHMTHYLIIAILVL